MRADFKTVLLSISNYQETLFSLLQSQVILFGRIRAEKATEL